MHFAIVAGSIAASRRREPDSFADGIGQHCSLHKASAGSNLPVVLAFALDWPGSQQRSPFTAEAGSLKQQPATSRLLLEARKVRLSFDTECNSALVPEGRLPSEEDLTQPSSISPSTFGATL